MSPRRPPRKPHGKRSVIDDWTWIERIIDSDAADEQAVFAKPPRKP